MSTLDTFPGAETGPRYIGRYRIVERIGRGTMGLVYAADDETMGRRVAIKVMMADLQEEPEVRERFYREARVTAQLTHPNIVTLFDFGEEGGHPYIVMELLNGVPLSDYLGTPPAASLDAKIAVMMQVCEGLQTAHAHGVIHRDIKPSNLFIQRDGTLKIVDFGVARLSSSSLTMSGYLVGTPEYMSPEQAQAREIDARSDLFSATAVFYFMLTGHGPFSSEDLPRVLRAVISEDPPPLTEADAPEALRRVIAKGLAKTPDDRYQQCAEMLADLDRVRRTYAAMTRRVVQAADDRYRQIVELIDERRALGRSVSMPDIESTCDQALADLSDRFPAFGGTASGDLDRSEANAALEALQMRHNAEAAALAALREAAADVLRRSDHAGTSPAAGDPKKSRAASLWKRMTPGGGDS